MHSSPGDLQTGLPARWLLRDRLVETSFIWGEESQRRVQLNLHNDLVLLSTTPKPLFEHPTSDNPGIVDSKVIEEFKARMHLISPLIDLTSSTRYKKTSSDGIYVCSISSYAAFICDLML